MQYDLTNLQKKNERRLPAVAKRFLYESNRNFWSYTMKFQIRHNLSEDSHHEYFKALSDHRIRSS